MRYWLNVFALVLVSTCGYSQGTLFRYQGQLQAGGNAAQGSFDMAFTLYDAYTNGNVIGTSDLIPAVGVNNGLFSVGLDFGQVFTGTNYWLSIGVRTSGSTNNFVTLLPRQPLTAVPYAVFANASSNLIGTLNASQLAGALPSAQLVGNYFGAVNFTNSENSFSGFYFGNGLNLTNLNGSMIATGIVADARLSTNVARLNTNQVFIGNNSFLGINQFPGPLNVFNGAHGGDGSSLTNLNGSQITYGTVADARLSTNVPLLNANQVFSGSNTFNGNGYFTGANTFTNRNNTFIGSFFGNGLVGWIPVSGTSTQAISDAGYVLLNSQLTTVTLPSNPSIGDIVRISGAGAGGWVVSQAGGQSVVGNFLSYANSSWLPSSAGSSAWIALASSADGSKMAAVSTGSSVVGISVDYGHSWSASGSLTAIWRAVASSADGSRLIAGQGTGGSVYYSTNFGATWTGGSTPQSANWFAIAMSANGMNAVAVASGGGIYTSTNGGVVWRLCNGAPTTAGWYNVASSASGANLAAVVYGGGIYTSANYGTNTWTLQTGAPSTNWTGIASSSDGTKLAAVAYQGGIYISSDSGATWTREAGAPTTNWESVVSSADGGRLAAVSYNDGVYLSDNSGVTWTRQNTGTLGWAAVCGSSDGGKLAAAVNQGGIYYSTATAQTTTTTGTSGGISGTQGSAVELQYIGNNQWMPVSSVGEIWAN